MKKFTPLCLLLISIFLPRLSAGVPPPDDAKVALVGNPRDTEANLAYAPSSGLTREQAKQFAVAMAMGMGKDVVVVGVEPTGSMRPFFNENALLLLEAVPFDQLKLGDVVTYWDDSRNQVVVHRLVYKYGDEYRARGDHNGAIDKICVNRQNYRRRLMGVLYMAPENANGKKSCPVPGPQAVSAAPVKK